MTSDPNLARLEERLDAHMAAGALDDRRNWEEHDALRISLLPLLLIPTQMEALSHDLREHMRQEEIQRMEDLQRQKEQWRHFEDRAEATQQNAHSMRAGWLGWLSLALAALMGGFSFLSWVIELATKPTGG